MTTPEKSTVRQYNYEFTYVHDVWTIDEATSFFAAYKLRNMQFDTRQDANDALNQLKMEIQSAAWKSIEAQNLNYTPLIYKDSNADNGKLEDYVDISLSKVIPADFIKWAHDKKLDMPEAFKNLLPSQNNKAEKALRPDQQAKERCRAIAEMLWDQNAAIKINEMTKRSEIVKYGTKGMFEPKTVYGWITDLAPKNRIKNKDTLQDDSAE